MLPNRLANTPHEAPHFRNQQGNVPVGPKKVLVVDDELTICQLMKAFLKTQGYSVEVANNGKEALSCFERGSFDIVLLDISMPGMQGTELLEHIKGLSPHCGVIVLSAYGDDGTINEAMGKGAFCYIQKPMELKDLARKMEALQQSLVAETV